jgi:uncharacterized protein YihD (DUF1040 family)
MRIKITDKAISVLNAEYKLWKNIISGENDDYDEDLKEKLVKAAEAAEERYWQKQYKLHGISYVRKVQYKQYVKELNGARYEKYPYD